MRFKLKSKRKPFSGESRYRIKFAWLPVKIDGYFLWLENFRVREVYFTNFNDWTIVNKYLLPKDSWFNV